ncbi:hypothetical protein VP01_1117g6 [Puccinia sorghi]|uniref:Uncharacterized protein n=1 Tax=Puccinia sorghi TaxID=27349 RepID=A0A0L6VSH7_9BASI|nr:hypothetical protein VP01_1117g6 [Puccinia sorghi]
MAFHQSLSYLYNSHYFFQFWMSVQINYSLTNACIHYHRGFYKKAGHYFGENIFYLFCILGKVAASIILLFYLTFFFLELFDIFMKYSRICSFLYSSENLARKLISFVSEN